LPVQPPKDALLDQILAALADPCRRRTVELLRERPRRAGELADILGVSAPAMSRHLRVLKSSGLIKDAHPRFDARVRIYSLNAGPMIALRQWLEETETLWAKQLAAFKGFVEADGQDERGR